MHFFCLFHNCILYPFLICVVYNCLFANLFAFLHFGITYVFPYLSYFLQRFRALLTCLFCQKLFTFVPFCLLQVLVRGDSSFWATFLLQQFVFLFTTDIIMFSFCLPSSVVSGFKVFPDFFACFTCCLFVFEKQWFATIYTCSFSLFFVFLLAYMLSHFCHTYIPSIRPLFLVTIHSHAPLSPPDHPCQLYVVFIIVINFAKHVLPDR